MLKQSTQAATIAKYFFLLILSVVLTGFTLVLGAIPLRVIRKTFGRRTYWLGQAVAVALCFVFLSHPIAIALALLTSLIGLYTDAEEAGSGFFSSGFFASITTSSFALVTAAFWASKKKLDLVHVAQTNVEQVLAQVKAVNPQVTWTAESLVYQVPSAFLIFLMASLAASLIWDRRLSQFLGVKFWENTSRSLLSFRAPDMLVWLTLAAVAGAFGQQKYLVAQNVCVNLVNVLALVYFFQGLAIAKHFFTINRVSRWWQILAFFLMLFQLFPLACVLGFSDYWVNYRTRFTKPRQSETQFKSEN